MVTDRRQFRTYPVEHCVAFRGTKERYGGLSNMAGGFPLRVNGIVILSAEALYQACRFPHRPEIQQKIIEQKSPMTAKMVSKPHRGDTRTDWDAIRIRVMRWVLRVKLAQHWSAFGDLLLATDDQNIVEDSRRDDFWGAVRENGTLVGMNVLGRLLMELRQELRGSERESLRIVAPPDIPEFFLLGQAVGLVGAESLNGVAADPDSIAKPNTLWAIATHEPPPSESPKRNGTGPTLARTTRPQPREGNMTHYPRRLIEVDLPIARISAHARREKSIRHGHISTLHIWWARRPLAACRAVICAALWPDPEDLTRFAANATDATEAPDTVGRGGPTLRPARFLDEARAQMTEWATRHYSKVSAESHSRLMAISKNPAVLDDPVELRRVLLDFIADFADWDHSTEKDYLATARALTQAAHEALGGEPGTRPLVVDPFAGGGSIPLEALRVGADAFASDLNPIPVLLNKVVLEYIPKYGNAEVTMPNAEGKPQTFHGLADAVRYWGGWIKEQAERELAAFYPPDPPDKKNDIPAATPIAYLWARTILSEAPGQGDIPVEVPLMRSLWLAKKAGRRRALRWVRDDKGRVKMQTVEVTYCIDGRPTPTQVKRPLLEIFEPKKDSEVEGGTVARGSATCPVTGFTTKVESVRAQLKKRRGGAADARLFCIVTTRADEQGRFYRLPTKADQAAFDAAAAELARRMEHEGGAGTQRSQVLTRYGGGTVQSGMSMSCTLSIVPDEPTPLGGGRGAGRAFSQRNYGMDFFADLFTPRQLLAMTTLARLVREAGARMAGRGAESAGSAGETFAAQGRSAAAQPSFSAPQGRGASAHGRGASAHGPSSAPHGRGDAPHGRSEAAHGHGAEFHGRKSVAHGSEKAVATSADAQNVPSEFADAVQTCLAMAMSRQADYITSLTIWANGGEFIAHTFGRQALPVVWEFPEVQPFSDGSGNFDGALGWVARVIEANSYGGDPGHVQRASATAHPLPDDAAAALFTDPPYYDAVPYSDLSDFFYVWLKRTLPPSFQTAFADTLTPKAEECIVDDAKGKDGAFFEKCMTQAMVEGRRVTRPDGVGVVVFAHKSTAGWETQLAAMIEAGWIITGSWPIDTERPGRLRAQDSAALASSVHIVMRPREHAGGEVRQDDVGDWRDVLAELPRRMHEWMPRLAAEGVVGADAIFACLGPALEVFSRYARVEKASGEVVTLGEYLEQVWAAVSKEALSLLFKDADAAGLEPDARLTAMWLWTLGGGKPQSNGKGDQAEGEGEDADDDDEDGGGKKAAAAGGFVLEFDAARKIAQGLGAHLEKLPTVVEVKGDKARLLSVAERTKHLFGKDAEAGSAKGKPKRSKAKQGSLFEELDAAEASSAVKWGVSGPTAGSTVLDRVHQAMILFAAGRGEALRRFLVDDGAGKAATFWKLAQSLSALYPAGTEEKRWVDGVLGRKKGLGL
ncbi:MAG: NADAR domain-containing protein [Phycisphaerae bacterium]